MKQEPTASKVVECVAEILLVVPVCWALILACHLVYVVVRVVVRHLIGGAP